ncbi:uncharacterized protein LOC132937098 [Metopolophium dirhodum]|uniref:uncharacterized protein LOC132937098 n=1 Tax=Metopolophium dirhodum TaxID=44670 RepID=UPI00298FE66D|nr:uncharacterized protein LOC132937098 [Metopolophium dirhodum]XP_060859909.1 uncharacterized protein LOC132937098 [Metopolophium dirhodum]XP_060859910.1 uncharacterized protein LOC132937098 [Metopolophium dirhodum]
MASSSKNWEPYTFSAEVLKEQRRQDKSINSRCSYDDTVELVWIYYDLAKNPGQERIKLGPSNKNHFGAEELEALKRQIKCINKRCSYGGTLFTAVEMVCAYYDVDYEPGKQVCLTCLKKYLNKYKYPEMELKEGQKKKSSESHF